jgi:signal transduction histidine kinase
VAVEIWSRVRADLARPETPTSPDERTFLITGAVVILVVAQIVEPGSAAELLLAAVAVGAFVLRAYLRRFPAELFAAMVSIPVTIVTAVEGVLEPMLFLSVTMVLYVAWSLGSWTRAVLIAVAAALLPPLASARWGPGDGITWAPWLIAHAFTFVLGRGLQRQQALIAELREARQALAAQAVAEERRRIARELHDLTGHTLAAMLLHVTGARHVLHRDQEEAERALLEAERVGRASLDQIRVTVAALRTTERGTDPALVGAADLDELVTEYRRAGLSIAADVAPAITGLAGPTGVALHRIAREALANVARHAPGNRVELRAETGDGRVVLLVADHGRPAPAADSGALHFGLVGMSERARALGGRLEAAPSADGWRVFAEMPVVDVERYVAP